ncbi:class I SAM-dependent methyltransferase [Marinicellulosiphila megalodicopiae]|uniref:class I SAM-dependent methyltransferase n=1 Tax=Marinicellulosiphila megalodicopiae TaxID=2724896 RepID=UPI003BAFC750
MTDAALLFNELTLQRYPVSSDASLTAFSQAEVLLAKKLDEQFNQVSLSIINENFGALSCVFNEKIQDSYNDSFLSQCATSINIEANQKKSIELNNDLSALKGDVIAGLIPKSLSFFQWQLEKLSQLNRPIVLAGMVKYISNGHIDLMNRYFESIDVSRAEKKARCMILSEPKQQSISQKNPSLEYNGVQLNNLPGVFCQKHIDIGARFFIENFKKIETHNQAKIADLGCGNGILSLLMANMTKAHALDFVLFDESKQAVDCAKQNWMLNKFDESAHSAQFIQNDGLLNQEAQSFDFILCNPPFHQNHTVGIHITQSLIKQANFSLKSDGQFWVIANRQLPYLGELKSHFKDVKLVNQNAKFKIFVAYN